MVKKYSLLRKSSSVHFPFNQNNTLYPDIELAPSTFRFHEDNKHT